jgi:hypothetical protein
MLYDCCMMGSQWDMNDICLYIDTHKTPTMGGDQFFLLAVLEGPRLKFLVSCQVHE